MAIFRHRAEGAFGGGEVFTFGIYSEGSLDITAAQQAWADGVTAFWSAALSARIATSVTMTAISTALLDPTDGYQVTRVEDPANQAGTATAQSLPYQVTPVVSTRTALATRAGRGRFYAPSLAVDQIDGGRMLPAAQQDLADSAQAMLQALATAGIPPVIWHRSASVSAEALSTTPITGIDVGDVLDTQRRRTNKLIEARTARPL